MTVLGSWPLWLQGVAVLAQGTQGVSAVGTELSQGARTRHGEQQHLGACECALGCFGETGGEGLHLAEAPAHT